jgi:cytoplasmic tRNA 2-thiolation protein 2
MAMLHWFYATFNDNTSNRKLFFKLKVLYVDDSFLYSSDYDSDRNNRKQMISDVCTKYGFPFSTINLEHAMGLPVFNSTPTTLPLEETDQEMIKSYLEIFHKIPNIGSFDRDFNFIMKRNLIFYYALLNSFNKVVFASNSDSLVSNIFSNIIKGRGFTIKEDINYIDNHYVDGKVHILRPMKDFLTKEVLLFNHCSNVDALFPYNAISRNVKHNIPFQGDTGELIGHFFDNLSNKINSTITTVMGTAEKIKERNGGKVCSFCLNYIDELYNPLEIGSIDSINNE